VRSPCLPPRRWRRASTCGRRTAVRNDGAHYDAISQREAIRIARRTGLAEIEDIRWSGNVWVIDGADRRGDDLRVEINRRGEIVDVDRSF
jgi:hypothetical protein